MTRDEQGSGFAPHVPQPPADSSNQVAADAATEPSMDPVQRYHEAWRLLEGRQPRDAIKLLDPVVQDQPQSTSLRTLRAWAYFQSAHLAGAESDLRMIVDERPTDVWARFALGRTLERQSRLQDALPHLRLAAVMSGDPEHETAVLRVERRLAERGDKSYDDLTS